MSTLPGKYSDLSIGGDRHVSALLHVKSTTKGTVPWPQMTTAQRSAIAFPDTGLTIYNTDTRAVEVYNGYSWGEISDGLESFTIKSVTTSSAVIKGGYLIIDDGRELATYDGAGSASSDFGSDLTINLTTVLGSAPSNATSYYLYIDLETLLASVSQSDTGRVVYKAVQGNFHLSTTSPEQKDPRRFIPLNIIRSATTGTSWLGVGSFFKTLATRRHETLTRFFSYPEVYSSAITSAAASNLLTHNLSGKPEVVELTYFDGTNEIGLDDSAHLLNQTTTQLNISSLGLTFGSGQELRVRAVKFPLPTSVASSSRTFTSAWFQNTSTTTVAHGLYDMEDIRGIQVQEWDVTAGKRKVIDTSALIVNFDAVNVYLDWTGLVPSSTLQYRFFVGGSPLPWSIPDGAFNNITDRSGAGSPIFPNGATKYERYLTKTSAYTALNYDKIFADTSGGAFTITLPASAAFGDVVELYDPKDTWDTANVTVGRNGHNINGAATDLTLDVEGGSTKLVYFDVTQGWRVY